MPLIFLSLLPYHIIFESNRIKNNVTLVLIQLATIGILHNINFKANILFTKIKSRNFSRRGKPKPPPPSIKTKKASNIEKIAKRLPMVNNVAKINTWRKK